MSVDFAPLGVFLTDSKLSLSYRSALSCVGELMSNGLPAIDLPMMIRLYCLELWSKSIGLNCFV